ncbi:hypothetical protein BDF19DRAFT_445077 [Syncephalis fuscata]|nr:hypothetical protein BDF19DRAFT_445077 [Syncephalis fuscata]
MFSFVLAMIANIINAITSLRGNPAAWAAQYLLQDLWRTIRVVALLLIMGIRIPKPISHNDYINSGDQLYTVHSNNNNNNNNNNHPDRWDNTKY